MKWIILPITLIGAVVWDIPALRGLVQSQLCAGVVYYLNAADRLWPLFALGAGAYLFRHRLPLSWAILGVLFLLLLGANALGVGLHVRALFVGYLVLCLGVLTAKPRSISARWPDYSYGTYIYAFPAMMVVHGLAPFRSHWTLGFATLAATLPLAALSWHLVEKPVLDAVKRRRAKRPEVVAQAV